MKITVNQLRRIIKEEVEKAIVVEGRDQGREDRKKINKVIRRFMDRLENPRTPKSLLPGIKQSIRDLETVRDAGDDYPEYDETDYGTEESEEYSGTLDVTAEEPMFESRRRSKAINEMTLPEMYEQFISALEAELSDPDTQETALAGLRKLLGVKVSDELLAREKAAREEKKAKGEKFNI